MNLPFTQSEFFDLFASYDLAIGPVPPLAAAIGAVLLLIGIMLGWRGRARGALGLLAVLWVWNGLVYHGLFFSRINPAAYVFAGLFILQGLLLGAYLVRGTLRLELGDRAAMAAGAALLGYALVIYPLWGAWLGHAYPRAPIFGVAPCPTTIFTFGLLVWMRPTKAVRLLLVVPVLWALVGTAAALSLGVPQDLGLPVAAAVALYVSLRRQPLEAPTAPAPA